MTTLYYVEIEARRALAVVRVNDIPVWRGAGVDRQGAGVCLNGVLHGQDRLEVRGVWARDGGQPGEGLLVFNISAYAPGEVVGIQGEQFFGSRIADEGPDGRIVLNAPVRSPLTARWRWMDAPPADPGDPAALRFVGRLAEAFFRGDADTLFAAMEPVFSERTQAFPADTVEAFRARLTRDFATPSAPGSPPPDPARLVLQPAANGRLLEVVDRAGAPFLVKTLPGGDLYPLPILIGRLGPDWAVYR